MCKPISSGVGSMLMSRLSLHPGEHGIPGHMMGFLNAGALECKLLDVAVHNMYKCALLSFIIFVSAG